MAKRGKYPHDVGESPVVGRSKRPGSPPRSSSRPCRRSPSCATGPTGESAGLWGVAPSSSASRSSRLPELWRRLRSKRAARPPWSSPRRRHGPTEHPSPTCIACSCDDPEPFVLDPEASDAAEVAFQDEGPGDEGLAGVGARTSGRNTQCSGGGGGTRTGSSPSAGGATRRSTSIRSAGSVLTNACASRLPPGSTSRRSSRLRPPEPSAGEVRRPDPHPGSFALEEGDQRLPVQHPTHLVAALPDQTWDRVEPELATLRELLPPGREGTAPAPLREAPPCSRFVPT